MAVKFKVEPLVESEGVTMFGLTPSTDDGIAAFGHFVEKSDNIAAGIGVTPDGRVFAPSDASSFYVYLQSNGLGAYKTSVTLANLTDGGELTFSVDR